MSALQVFNYQNQNMRLLDENGEEWFVASDVAKILGYRNAPDMTRRLDEDDKGTRSVRTLGGEQKATVISLPGLFVAILGSKVKGAKEFKRWVTHEVLPSIRKTDSYSMAPVAPVAMTPRELAMMVIAEADRADAAEEQLAIAAPKVEAYDSLMKANGTLSIREAAQLLQNEELIETGQNRLFDWMRENYWLDSSNQPIQRKVDAKLMTRKLNTKMIRRSDGTWMETLPQARVTPKGLVALRRALIREQNELRLELEPERRFREIAPVQKRTRRTLNPERF
jgi:prophage antirepressor-like protein